MSARDRLISAINAYDEVVSAAENIRILCGATGVDWSGSFARDRLQQFDAALAALNGTPPNALDQRVLDELEADRKINAIKMYRTVYCVTLKEAKDAIYRYLRAKGAPT